MKKFLIKIILISMPLWPLSVSYLILVTGGEYCDLDKVCRFQSLNDSVLYGPAYVNKDVEYKTKYTLLKKPELLILGTSRVMQFQKKSFDAPFYNSGGIVAAISHVPIILKYFLEHKYKPGTLILGLDQDFFNPYYHPEEYSDEAYKERLSKINTSELSPNYTDVIFDFLGGKIHLNKLASHNIGINAQQLSNGFRADGSYFCGGFILYGDNKDKNFQSTLFKIKKGSQRFKYSDEVDKEAVKILKEIIKICDSNKIHLIAFLPPYAPSIYDKMKQSKHYEYLSKIFPAVNSLFEEKKFKLYDFGKFENSSDSEFFDGFHGNAGLYEKIAKVINSDKTKTQETACSQAANSLF